MAAAIGFPISPTHVLAVTWLATGATRRLPPELTPMGGSTRKEELPARHRSYRDVCWAISPIREMLFNKLQVRVLSAIVPAVGVRYVKTTTPLH